MAIDFIEVQSAMTRESEKSVSDLAGGVESETEKKFHGWRLLGVVFLVIVVLALVSAAVDWAVIGPLEGRVFD